MWKNSNSLKDSLKEKEEEKKEYLRVVKDITSIKESEMECGKEEIALLESCLRNKRKIEEEVTHNKKHRMDV